MIFGLHDHLLPGPAPGRRLPGRSPPDLVLRGAADLGETEGGDGDRLRSRVRRGPQGGRRPRPRSRDEEGPRRTGRGLGAARARRSNTRKPTKRSSPTCAPGSASTSSRRSTSAPRRRRARCSSSSSRSGSRWPSSGGCRRPAAIATLNPPERIKVGTVGAAGAGSRAEAGRGRRGAGPGRAGDDRLPQRPREDRGDDRRRGLAAHRRRRRDRRRRLPDDRRSQEGADHQLGRQEHVAGQHRGEAEGGQRR